MAISNMLSTTGRHAARASMRRQAAEREETQRQQDALLRAAAKGDVRACITLGINRREAQERVLDRTLAGLMRNGASDAQVDQMVGIVATDLGITSTPAASKQPRISPTEVYARMNAPQQDAPTPRPVRTMGDIASNFYARQGD